MIQPEMTAGPVSGAYAHQFARLRQEGRKALIPFTLLGWPNPKASLELIRCLMDHGASALELGIAFSDPMADGPIIQQAAMETLAAGVRVQDALDLAAQVRQLNPVIPMGLMVYYNMVLARGAERFLADAAKAGINSILIPDLPAEASGEIYPIATDLGVTMIMMVSPLTRAQRLQQMVDVAGGFWYVISRLGITGLDARYDAELQDLMQRVRQMSSLPMCVGFGISTPEQAYHMTRLGADGVIIGSKIIDLVRQAPDQPVELVLGPYLDAVQAVLTDMEDGTTQLL